MTTRARGILILVFLAAGFALVPGAAIANKLDFEVCGTWSPTAGDVVPSSAGGLQATSNCGPTPAVGFEVAAPFPNTTTIPDGANAGWTTTAPPGIVITGADTRGDYSNGIDDGNGYFGEFFWDNGRNTTALGDNFSTNGFSGNFATQHFGWFIQCASSSGCTYPAYAYIAQLFLTAIETTSPAIYPGGALWSDSGWIRGALPVSFGMTDPSGVCSTAIVSGGQTIDGPSSTPQTDVWHQCPNPLWSTSVDTRTLAGSDGVGEGDVPLAIRGTDAAGNWNFVSKVLHVDNATPTVTLSGPTSAPATAGTQDITASASAGPSGVSGLSCSVDGAPDQWHPGPTAQLPVSGAGVHTATCVAYNNAHDASGADAASAPATYSITLTQATVAGVWFPSEANAPTCRRVRARVRVPARWITVRRGGRRVKVRKPAHTVVRSVKRCSLRTIRVKTTVWVTVIRHGRKVRVKRTRYIRSVLPPRAVSSASARIAFGHGAPVEGWLGTAALSALGGQQVIVLAAPDNGQGAFQRIATTTTNSDGFWVAQLPPGPSRIVEAVYPGSGTLAATASSQITVTVPARLGLRIRPRHARWGGTIRISGSVLGGYVPPDGELVLLRIGWKGGSTEIGHVSTNADGRFSVPYHFLRGNGTETYWIWATTARESDYPYAPASSHKVAVTVTPP